MTKKYTFEDFIKYGDLQGRTLHTPCPASFFKENQTITLILSIESGFYQETARIEKGKFCPVEWNWDKEIFRQLNAGTLPYFWTECDYSEEFLEFLGECPQDDDDQGVNDPDWVDNGNNEAFDSCYPDNYDEEEEF